MAADCTISHRIRTEQERLFRIACRDTSLKAISLDSGIPYSTLRSYAGHNGETAEMPLSALYKLCGVIRTDLLSILLPDAQAIINLPDGLDHDSLCDKAEDYTQAKIAAHRADSECGVEIGPRERKVLDLKAAGLKAA